MAPTLVTAIGFKPELVTGPRESVEADRVIGIVTPHPRSQQTAKELQETADEQGWVLVLVDLADAFDFLGWYKAWQHACSLAGETAVVNMTAGHGMSTAAAAVHASNLGVHAIVYDDLLGEAHQFTPRILQFLDDLTDVEQLVLHTLVKGPRTVSGLATACGLELSRTSKLISKLQEKGFIQQQQRGRERINSLRPGVALAVASVT